MNSQMLPASDRVLTARHELKSVPALEDDIALLEKQVASLKAALRCTQSELKKFKRSLRTLQKGDLVETKELEVLPGFSAGLCHDCFWERMV